MKVISNIMIRKVDEMISSLESWLQSNDYNYIECNYVPDKFWLNNKKWNVILRTFFRLCPYNLRNICSSSNGMLPITPQSTVALLKAYSIVGNKVILEKLYKRALDLRSPKTKYFALKQGIKISINLYENSADDPTPLNTVWFGRFLLDEHSGLIPEKEKKYILFSIVNYLLEELGYADHQEDGVYFYYGPTLKKEIYNASAIISAFLIDFGIRYGDDKSIDLGTRGIKYICTKQNEDGSWFYAGSPERPTIDCFHQSYILQAIYSVKDEISLDISRCIEKGLAFYRTLFFKVKNGIRPIRYDKRYTPHNTWLFVKTDGRDIAEALVFFSKYVYDEKIIEGLLEYMYNVFYSKKNGYMYPELFIYGKNKIPYIEFQAWFLYALQIVKSNLR